MSGSVIGARGKFGIKLICVLAVKFMVLGVVTCSVKGCIAIVILHAKYQCILSLLGTPPSSPVHENGSLLQTVSRGCGLLYK